MTVPSSPPPRSRRGLALLIVGLVVVAGVGAVLVFQSGSLSITVTNAHPFVVYSTVTVDGSVVQDQALSANGSYQFLYTVHWSGFICTGGKVSGWGTWNSGVSAEPPDIETYSLCDGGSNSVPIGV